MKAVLFATGPLYHASREALALRERLGKDSVQVVAASKDAAALRSQVDGISVVSSGFTLLIRLWMFVGFGPAHVYCLSYGHSHRLLKLLAYAVRGHVTFVGSAGQALLPFSDFLVIRFRMMTAREPGTLLIGSASTATLTRLASDLKQRRADTQVDVLDRPSAIGFAVAASNWRRYQFLAIPWTGEGRNFLKLAAWLLPCGRAEIYNEAGDSFYASQGSVLWAHVARRNKEGLARLWHGLRYAAWRTGDSLENGWNKLRYGIWWIGDRSMAAWYASIALPRGISVIGSASGYYMKDIVTDLRRKHPGQQLYGLLPGRLIVPAGPLFDRVIPLSPLNLLRHMFGPNRTGYLALPCTNEGYNRYKLMAAFLPLGRRLIYNENGDGYPLRRWNTAIEHGFWRLRHRLFYQAFTQRRGRSLPVLWMHLLLYPLRLVAGAWTVAGIRIRAHIRRPAPRPAAPFVEREPMVAVVSTAQQPDQVLDPAEP